MVQTLRTCRALRPKAKWGFYGYPVGGVYDVGNGSAPLTAFAEAQRPIFEAAGALYPSIYLPLDPRGEFPWMDAAYYRRYVRTMVEQSVLLSKAAAAPGGARPPVYPFAWSFYHNGTTVRRPPRGG